jgi:hypothetical protein
MIERYVSKGSDNGGDPGGCQAKSKQLLRAVTPERAAPEPQQGLANQPEKGQETNRAGFRKKFDVHVMRMPNRAVLKRGTLQTGAQGFL